MHGELVVLVAVSVVMIGETIVMLLLLILMMTTMMAVVLDHFA